MNEQIKLSLAVLALTVGIYLLVAYMLGWIIYLGQFGLHLLIGAALGAIVAGVAYALAPKG
ncbi:MAG: hypothetical protein SFU86_14935 [Pirellulaceae bacterium]|nr:hypothetical protein [Pirellulaceae bacterium]